MAKNEPMLIPEEKVAEEEPVSIKETWAKDESVSLDKANEDRETK